MLLRFAMAKNYPWGCNNALEQTNRAQSQS